MLSAQRVMVCWECFFAGSAGLAVVDLAEDVLFDW